MALESTLISHGLPRPDNLTVAREAVRAEGAVPATVGVVGGVAHDFEEPDSGVRHEPT